MKYNEDLFVYYNDIPVLLLNHNLFETRGCWDNLSAIKEAHELKLCIQHLIIETSNRRLLKSLALDITEIEFELQRLWGFSQDAKSHRFWNLPKCTCPKHDNEDRHPSAHGIINRNCVLHG